MTLEAWQKRCEATGGSLHVLKKAVHFLLPLGKESVPYGCNDPSMYLNST